MTKLLFLLTAAMAAGCAATIPLRPLDATHPASPDAREAPPVRLPSLDGDGVAVPAAPAPHGGHHHAH